jgi:LysM repeat protein
VKHVLSATPWYQRVGLLLACSILVGCGYVRVRWTPTAALPTPTQPVELITPSWRATATPLPSTPLPTSTPTPTPTPIVHVVDKGDLLIHIASEYNVSMQAIIDANGIVNPHSLPIGQRLVIPRSEEEARALLPTSTPTPMPLDIVRVGLYRTPAGSVWCMGEVDNPHEQALDMVQVQVLLYSTSGQLLDRNAAFTLADVVPARGVAPFAVLLSGASAERFASHVIDVLSAEPVTAWGHRHRSLVVKELQGAEEDGQYVVRGIVHNEGEVGAQDVRVTVTVYAEDDTVVAVRQIRLDTLAAGDERPFVATLLPAAPPVSLGAVAWGMDQAEE